MCLKKKTVPDTLKQKSKYSFQDKIIRTPLYLILEHTTMSNIGDFKVIYQKIKSLHPQSLCLNEPVRLYNLSNPI